MKTHSKNTFVGLLGLSLLLTPLAAFAAPRTGAGFCTQIDTILEKQTTNQEARLATFTEKKQARLASLTEKRTLRDEKRGGHRGDVDARHDARFDALMTKADTDAKKAAVTTFEADVNAAIAKRRTAVDAAVTAFRSGVDALVQGNGGSLDSAIATLTASIDAAGDKAKDACVAGTDSRTVAEAFRADVKAARETFKNTRTTEAIRTQIQALATVRKNAVAGAVATFKADMDAAKTKLKTAFGE